MRANPSMLSAKPHKGRLLCVTCATNPFLKSCSLPQAQSPLVYPLPREPLSEWREHTAQSPPLVFGQTKIQNVKSVPPVLILAVDSGLNRWMAHPMRYIPQNNLITPGGPLPLHRGQITTNPTSDIRIQGELRLIDGNRQACPVHASHLPCYCSGVRWFFPTHPLPHTFFLLRSA